MLQHLIESQYEFYKGANKQPNVCEFILKHDKNIKKQNVAEQRIVNLLLEFTFTWIWTIFGAMELKAYR